MIPIANSSSLSGGDWQIVDGQLVSPVGEYPRIQVPYIPPEEYRIDMIVEVPKEGGKNVALGLIKDNTRFFVHIDAAGPASAIERIDGRVYRDNESKWSGDALTRDRLNEVTCLVTKEAIQVATNGKKIIDWRGAASRLSVYPA